MEQLSAPAPAPPAETTASDASAPVAPAAVAPLSPEPAASGPDKFFLDQGEETPVPGRVLSPPTVFVDEAALPAPPSTCGGCERPVGPAPRCEHCGAAHRAGKYQVMRVVSQGPHGRVYEALGPGGERVALKELIFALVPDAAALDAFDREAALLKAISHAQVPRYVDAFHEGAGVHTRCYLAQEFVEGEPLQEVIAREPLTSEEARRLAKQVLRLVDALHCRHPPVLHRDIKPANLILRPDGLVTLVDFGSARLLPRGVTHGATLVGTFGYMPPEQLGGTVDESSDLYALGATLMHALTGRPPEEMTRDGLRLDVDQHLGDVDPRLKRVIKRLVAPNRALRFQSAREALAAITLPESRRTLLAAAAAALVAAAGFGYAWRSVSSGTVGSWTSQVQRSRPPSEFPRTMGGISVITLTPGAEVTVDGTRLRTPTPIHVPQAVPVRPGPHLVTFTQSGATGSEMVLVREGEVAVVVAHLKGVELPAWALPMLRSKVALSAEEVGVPVYIDGLPAGRVTPIGVSNPYPVVEGPHYVQFRKDGVLTRPRPFFARGGELVTLWNLPVDP